MPLQCVSDDNFDTQTFVNNQGQDVITIKASAKLTDLLNSLSTTMHKMCDLMDSLNKRIAKLEEANKEPIKPKAVKPKAKAVAVK
jgi:hypothetical protein